MAISRPIDVPSFTEKPCADLKGGKNRCGEGIPVDGMEPGVDAAVKAALKQLEHPAPSL
ncbi:MAG: hypothetical protein M9953_05525 [Thermomicrobiales bacterium]|nr:hypothetical protein [Thermomicrobiales bacterium]